MHTKCIAGLALHAANVIRCKHHTALPQVCTGVKNQNYLADHSILCQLLRILLNGIFGWQLV